jgi:hypothetical protein
MTRDFGPPLSAWRGAGERTQNRPIAPNIPMAPIPNIAASAAPIAIESATLTMVSTTNGSGHHSERITPAGSSMVNCRGYECDRDRVQVGVYRRGLFIRRS